MPPCFFCKRNFAEAVTGPAGNTAIHSKERRRADALLLQIDTTLVYLDLGFVRWTGKMPRGYMVFRRNVRKSTFLISFLLAAIRSDNGVPSPVQSFPSLGLIAAPGHQHRTHSARPTHRMAGMSACI
jgi:hypothetical protein